jgi:hypothetical protein
MRVSGCAEDGASRAYLFRFGNDLARRVAPTALTLRTTAGSSPMIAVGQTRVVPHLGAEEDDRSLRKSPTIDR